MYNNFQLTLFYFVSFCLDPDFIPAFKYWGGGGGGSSDVVVFSSENKQGQSQYV